MRDRSFVLALMTIVVIAVALIFWIATPSTPDAGAPSVSGRWEDLGDDVRRYEIPGGWLVRMKDGYGAGLTYVPDPDKEWR